MKVKKNPKTNKLKPELQVFFKKREEMFEMTGEKD